MRCQECDQEMAPYGGTPRYKCVTLVCPIFQQAYAEQRLHAAAADLLAACKLAVKALHGDYDGRFQHDVDIIEAAIAKAEVSYAALR